MDDEVTRWLQGLAQGDETAIQRIWERYCTQLVGAARKKLGRHPRRMADEEDVAFGQPSIVSVEGLQQTDFPNLTTATIFGSSC